MTLMLLDATLSCCTRKARNSADAHAGQPVSRLLDPSLTDAVTRWKKG